MKEHDTPNLGKVSDSSTSSWEQRGESRSASPTFSRHGAKVHPRKANAALRASSSTYRPVLRHGKVFSCSRLQFPHLKRWGGNDGLTQSGVSRQMVDVVCYPERQRPSSWTASELFPFNLNFFSKLYATNRINRSGSKFRKLILSTLTFPTVIHTLLPETVFVLPQNCCQDQMRV